MTKGIHIAVIPDGNRRFARKNHMPIWWGHKEGAKALKRLGEWSKEHPEIKMITVYALSTENLNRTKEEVKMLWDGYKKEFEDIMNSDDIKENELRINIIGDESTWRDDVRRVAKDVMKATESYSRTVLNILLSYGSKYEIMNTVKKMVATGVKMPLVEDTFNKYMMITKPVDLVIRTGGEHRLSNFLLYQAAYAEIYFSDTLWPEFSKKEFESILEWYKNRDRRMGK